MGDRTFSAQDVIRIYEFFLTAEEQEIVDRFFEVEDPSLLPFVAVRNLLGFLEPLLEILASTEAGIIAALLGATARRVLGLAIAGLASIIRILEAILLLEEV